MYLYRKVLVLSLLMMSVGWGNFSYNKLTDEPYDLLHTNENSEILNVRDIDFTEHIVSSNYDGTTAVFPVDMDNDGDIDIVSCHRDSDIVTWHENDGYGNFTHHNDNYQ
jgi:hypothetical protein